MKKKPSVSRRTEAGKLLLTFLFLMLLFVPLGRMLIHIHPETVAEVLQTSIFPQALKNSVVSALLSTLITVILSYFFAVAMERTDIPHKGFFRTMLVLPMLIPSIAHGMGLITLLGNNGILTRFFHLGRSIYGLGGIVFGSVMYAFPIAFLMFADVLKYEDSAPYEAAAVLGLSKAQQFTALTLPYLRKPLISIIFAVFTLVVTDYGVPLMVGGKYTTIPVVMYQEVIGQLNFDRGSVYGAILLAPAVLAFVLDQLNRDKGNSAYGASPFSLYTSPGKRLLAYGYCILLSGMTLLPLFSFVLTGFAEKYPTNLCFSLKNISKTMDMGAGGYLINSVTIAAFVTVIGCFVVFLTAYFTVRMPSKSSRFLHLSSITSAAIPGIVLGLSYTLVFRGSFLQGTRTLLILVNLVHFISSPYLMMYNALHKLNENLEAVGETLGISRMRMILGVVLPQCTGTLLEIGSYFFVNCMMTISAVSFLATTANKPIALMINQFEAQMQLESAAIVSLAILGVNLLMKGLVYLVNTYKTTQKEQAYHADEKTI